jgi:hypothetical protein
MPCGESNPPISILADETPATAMAALVALIGMHDHIQANDEARLRTDTIAESIVVAELIWVLLHDMDVQSWSL